MRSIGRTRQKGGRADLEGKGIVLDGEEELRKRG